MEIAQKRYINVMENAQKRYIYVMEKAQKRYIYVMENAQKRYIYIYIYVKEKIYIRHGKDNINLQNTTQNINYLKVFKY